MAFIEPTQGEVIEKILGHCALWQESASRAPPDIDCLARELDLAFFTPRKGPHQSDQAYELTYVDIDTFLPTF